MQVENLTSSPSHYLCEMGKTHAGQSGEGLVKWSGAKLPTLCLILTQERKEKETEIDGLELRKFGIKKLIGI